MKALAQKPVELVYSGVHKWIIDLDIKKVETGVSNKIQTSLVQSI